MWFKAPLYRKVAQGAAERIFGHLDPGFDPYVFLVGIRLDEKGSPDRTSLVPPDCDFDRELFWGVMERAERIEQDTHGPTRQRHPASRLVHGTVTAASLGEAVRQIVREQDAVRGRTSFGSFPLRVGHWWTCVVLQLDRTVVRGYPSIPTEGLQDLHPQPLPRSLPEATVGEFLAACVHDLGGPSPGLYLDLEQREPDEVIRAAGRALMRTVARASRFPEPSSALFDACDTVSSLRYERGEASGRMIVAPPDHPGVEPVLRLSTPLGIRDHRAARKLLETVTPVREGLAVGGRSERGGNDLCLLTDSSRVYGLARVRPGEETAPLFFVDFVSHHSWQLVYGGEVLMRVTYGEPALPKPRLAWNRFNAEMKTAFPELVTRQCGVLWGLVGEASRQRHGTMLVISEGAAEEAERLGSQSMRIEPLALTPETTRAASAIDGAVLLDPTGVCHAIGVILDGLATDRGNPARGARFNSAVRYVESSRHRCAAVVISEDGYVDLVTH